MRKALIAVKLVAIVAFLVTLGGTYIMRSEVLLLNEIRFSADNARAEQRLLDMEANLPLRTAEYEARMEHHELQMDHYTRMLALYRTDYSAYVTRLEDEYRLPPLPERPSPPSRPEYSEQLVEANAAFRAQQYDYFSTMRRLNGVACVSALLLVGCLLFLVLFDDGYPRVLYFASLLLSFVFLIGPSFHSILSAVVGLLEAPSLF
jgi:hypothetical protein